VTWAADASGARARIVSVRGAVLRLAGVLRSSRTYSPDNRAIAEGLRSAQERLHPLLLDLGELLIRMEGDLVQVNGTIIAQTGQGAIRELAQFAEDLASRGLGGLHVTGQPTFDQLRTFVEVWRNHPDLPRESGADTINEQLRFLAVHSMVVLPRRDPRDGLVEQRPDTIPPHDSLRAYCGLLAVGEMVTDPSTGDLPATLRRADAALHVAADVVAAAPETLLCAACHRDSRRYPAVHAANTTVLSMVLARAIGLGIDGILDVGWGALFCDVGMYSTAAAARDAPGDLDRATLQAVLGHPVQSFLRALTTEGLSAGLKARLAVAWEHHCGVDGEGYPGRPPDGLPHMYSRIVSIADGYDALVHDRGDRAGLPRPVALEVLYQEADRRFDRTLLREFCAVLGRFPPGSVVRLRDGEIALAAAPSWDPRLFDRPTVIVIRDPSGQPVKPQVIDLGSQLGERASRIVQVLDDRMFPERLISLVLGDRL